MVDSISTEHLAQVDELAQSCRWIRSLDQGGEFGIRDPINSPVKRNESINPINRWGKSTSNKSMSGEASSICRLQIAVEKVACQRCPVVCGL